MGIYNYIVNSIKGFYEQYKRSREIEMSSEESSQANFRMSWFTGQGLFEEMGRRVPSMVRIKSQGQSYSVLFNKDSHGEIECTGIEKVLE
jgi:hypothetical protein